jgi:hypothetical protein
MTCFLFANRHLHITELILKKYMFAFLMGVISLWLGQRYLLSCLFVCLMVFNAIFNNISVISWWSVLLVEETGVQTLSYNVVHLALFEIRTHRGLSSSFSIVLYFASLKLSDAMLSWNINKCRRCGVYNLQALCFHI